eukprot:TRINITY_DN205_c0_g2_i6.p2 TRINITY_DN205_c0_g2~~TRINITY_DN205_c0_g2_i6.p2  ORF type:complete len:146 (-),score=24.46 TRINITY_DN205_c0_g2_i6:563-1000(-)
MPFWTFFTATWIGKALIKVCFFPSTSLFSLLFFQVNLQAFFFITVFTEEHLASFVEFIERMIPDKLDPCILLVNRGCHHLISDALRKTGAKFRNVGVTEEEGFGWKSAWNCVIFCFIGYFIVSCIEQFAQAKANSLKKESEKKSK